MSQSNWKQHTKTYNKILRPIYLKEEEKLSSAYNYDFLIRDLKFNEEDSLIALLSQPDNYSSFLYLFSIEGEMIYHGSIFYEYDNWKGRSKPRTYMREVKVIINRIHWSIDNKNIFCSTNDGIYEFNILNKKFRRFFKESVEENYQGLFTDITINQKDNLLAVLGYGKSKTEQGSIYILDFSGSLLKKIENVKHPTAWYGFDRLLYSSDFTKLFSIGDDKFLRIWDFETGELLDENELDLDKPNEIHLIPNENKLLIGYSLIAYDEQGKITDVTDINKLVDAERYQKNYYYLLNNGKQVITNIGRIYNFNGIEVGVTDKYTKIFSANNKDLLALVKKRVLEFYSGKELTEQFTQIHEERLASKAHAVIFSHNNKMVAVMGKGTYIGTLDGKSFHEGTLKKVFEKKYWTLAPSKAYQKDGTVYQAVWSKNDKDLWCATSFGLYLFSTDDQEFTAIYTDHALYCIAFNPNKEYYAVAGYPGTKSEKYILLFDLQGKLIRKIVSPHTEGYIEHLSFSSDYTKIFTCCVKGYLRIFDEDTGDLLDQTTQRIKELYPTFYDNKFIIYSGGKWYLLTLSEEGKNEGIISIKSSQLSFYLPRKMAKFIENNSRDNFTVVGTNSEIFAEVSPSSGIDPPIKFFSSTDNSREFFFDITKPVKVGWVKKVTIPKITRLKVFNRLDKFPNKWLAVHWNEIVLYDDEFNETACYDFKNPNDSTSVKYVIDPCDFSEKTQKLIGFVYYSSMRVRELHIIDFNSIEDFSSLKDKKYLNRPTTDDDFTGSGPVMLKWSPDGEKIAAIDDHSHHIIIYNNDLEIIHKKRFDLRHGPRNIVWSPTSDKIAIGFFQGIVYIYNIENGTIEKSLPTVDIEDINKMTWSAESGELTIPSTRYINIFNKEGYIIRKLDLKEEAQFDKTNYIPGTSKFAIVSKIEKEESVIIIDRNKEIRECQIQLIPFLTDSINYLRFETNDSLIVQSNIGLSFWKKI